MRRIGRRFPMLVGLSLLLPTAAGFVLHGFTVQGAIRGYIWGGLVRIFLVHHVTWSVNSVCHFFGRRRFDVDDRSTNVAWLASPPLESPGTTTTTPSPQRPSRPAMVGARSLRPNHHWPRATRAGMERRPHRTGASGRPPGSPLPRSR